MADRDEILAYAAELLDLDAYPDYGPMGMQVAGAREVDATRVRRLGVARALRAQPRQRAPRCSWSTTGCSGTATRA